MRLEQLFNLSRNKVLAETSETATASAFVKVIQQNCRDWLQACHTSNSVVWRGLHLDALGNNSWKKLLIASNRPAVDMPAASHELLHQAYLRLGITATRKNSIFCSTNYETADEWGIPCIIFVKNGWSGVAWESGRDDYSFYNQRRLTDMKVDAAQLATELTKKDTVHRINNSPDLAEILTRGWNDFLITGSSYYALKTTAVDEDETEIGLSPEVEELLDQLNLSGARNLP